MNENEEVPESVKEATKQVIGGLMKMMKALEDQTNKIRARVDELENVMKNG